MMSESLSIIKILKYYVKLKLNTSLSGPGLLPVRLHSDLILLFNILPLRIHFLIPLYRTFI